MEASTKTGFGPRDVAFGTLVAQIPAYYRLSLELYLAGNHPGAVRHASHPLMEVLPRIYEDLLESDLAAPLARVLGAAASTVRERKPAQEVGASFEAATKLSADAIDAVVGSAASTGTFRASLVAGLLRVAARSYRTAVVEDGIVRLLPEYQSAYAAIAQATRMTEDLSASGLVAMPVIDDALSALRELVPTPLPDDVVANADDVDVQVEVAAAELAAAGALLRTTSTPAEVMDRIEYRFALLADLIAHGENGRAEKLVARIFAEDYSVIADDVHRNSPELGSQIESLLADLRIRVNRGATRADVGPDVERVLGLLRSAVERLPSVT